MQNIYLLLVILLMGISCKEQKTKEQPLAAQETAVKVRDHWKEVESPFPSACNLFPFIRHGTQLPVMSVHTENVADWNELFE